MLVAVSGVFAVPAKRHFARHNQGDGTAVTVTMRGDEFSHALVTLDGLTVERGYDGALYYTSAAGITHVKAHNPDERGNEELQFIDAMHHVCNMKALHSIAPQRKVRAKTQVPQTGSPAIPIILVNFSDIKFKSGDNAQALFDNQFRSGEKSCFQYFVDQSYGQYTPQFDVLGPVNLKKPRADYGGNDRAGNDRGLGTMVVEACEGLQNVDFAKYDNDGDGAVDVVVVLFAGVGEAQAWETTPDAVWPCQWDLDECFRYGYSTKAAFTLNGVTINKFAVFNELYGDNDNTEQVDGIGTFCHEFSHCLGLPDFYDTADNPVCYGMDEWSLLDYGCYNDDGYTPVSYTAYEREFMGWITIETLQEGKQYTIKPLTEPDGKAYQYVNPKNANERLIVENRQKIGWNEFMSAQGLMITHVDYSAAVWNGNSVNTNPDRQRMTIYPADGVLSTDTNYGDLYPYENVTALDSVAEFYRGGFIGKPLDGITQNDDGTVTFRFVKTELLIGDVDRNGVINTSDVTALVNMILGIENIDTEVADVDQNGNVNVSDVTALVNIILNL